MAIFWTIYSDAPWQVLMAGIGYLKSKRFTSHGGHSFYGKKCPIAAAASVLGFGVVLNCVVVVE